MPDPESHEPVARSTSVAANKLVPAELLTEWGKVLHDEDLAAAILDRILERGRFIHLDGPSGRTRHVDLEKALSADPNRARISGISVPEFPEPTNALEKRWHRIQSDAGTVATFFTAIDVRRLHPGDHAI